MLLIPCARHRDPSRFFEPCELPVHGACASVHKTNQLGTLETPIRLTEKQTEHPLLHRREESPGKTV
jgi:hypothetical protein